MVLIAGDIIDDNIKVVKHKKLLKHFKDLSPKYGIYACPGNHEYISRANHDFEYFAQYGINFLKDSVITIDNQFVLIGKDDIANPKADTTEFLKSLPEETDFSLPVIFMNHQPYNLPETAKYPIDFQLSGHTHRGQVWPLNLLTSLIFEQDWGYLKKEDTHFYISSGYGTAVLPMKIGSPSEIIDLRITNK